MSSIVAVIKSIIGQVFAVSIDGLKRQVFEGDQLFAGEQLLTDAGGSATMQLASGEVVQLGASAAWQAGNPQAEAEAGNDDEPVSELEQALAEGFDPTTGLEETAAGAAAGGGTGGAAGGGHSFVILDATGQQLEATVGFETAGLGFVGEGLDEELGGADDGDTITGIVDQQANRAPTALADEFTVNEDDSISINVLGNDSDLDGDSLSITQVNGQAISEGNSVTITNGSITLTNGQLVFTPDANYNGPVSFSYTISDGVLSSTAAINGTVNPQNDAPVIVVTAAPALQENSAAEGNTVATFTATDEEDGVPAVDFTPGSNDAGYYAINGNNVVL
ncbi:retention module-containing protein, partial [Pseudomonas sp. 8AS]|uniref:retention module-containing protein n=1 Tax=Pseudomonas sp. 8AS TaxID=2653163 RepID=UPI0013581CA5